MSKVLVDREMLERCVDRWACCAIVETPGAEQAWLELRAVVKAAQPAEAEGVEAVEFWVLFDATTPEPYIKKMMPEGFLAFFDHEEDAIRAKSFHPGTDYKRVPYVRQSAHIAALSAVTAERDRLRAVLEGAQYPNIDRLKALTIEQCRRVGETVMRLTIDAQSERDQLRAEVEALRKDAVRWRYVRLQGDDMHWLNLLRVDLDDFGGNINAAVDALIDGDTPAMAAKEA